MFNSGDGFIISGDTIFRLSVGRWDLPGGDFQVLMNSIKQYILNRKNTSFAVSQSDWRLPYHVKCYNCYHIIYR